MVEDLPEVIASVSEQQKQLESAKSSRASHGRVQYLAHSFFDAQPVVGADVYLLRMILHDWAFNDAVKILQNIVPAMKKPSSRIIIMDTVLPDPGSVPAAKERLLRVRDLTMMQVFNSQERAIEDWKAIFAEVDPKLTIRSISQPRGERHVFDGARASRWLS